MELLRSEERRELGLLAEGISCVTSKHGALLTRWEKDGKGIWAESRTFKSERYEALEKGRLLQVCLKVKWRVLGEGGQAMELNKADQWKACRSQTRASIGDPAAGLQ